MIFLSPIFQARVEAWHVYWARCLFGANPSRTWASRRSSLSKVLIFLPQSHPQPHKAQQHSFVANKLFFPMESLIAKRMFLLFPGCFAPIFLPFENTSVIFKVGGKHEATQSMEPDKKEKRSQRLLSMALWCSEFKNSLEASAQLASAKRKQHIASQILRRSHSASQV